MLYRQKKRQYGQARIIARNQTIFAYRVSAHTNNPGIEIATRLHDNRNRNLVGALSYNCHGIFVIYKDKIDIE